MIELTKAGKQKLKKFFDEFPFFMNLIEDEDYGKLYFPDPQIVSYIESLSYSYSEITSLITVVLLHIGINPLMYLNSLPHNFIDTGTPFNISNDFVLTIPGNIKNITPFIYTNKIRKFNVEEGVKWIDSYSFTFYREVPIEVKLPKSIEHIDNVSFPKGSTVFVGDYDSYEKASKSGRFAAVWFRDAIGTIVFPDGKKIVKE